MDEDREQKVSDIKRRIRQGEYKVDPSAVADAIIRRWREFGVADPQNECSYPPSSPGAPTNLIAGGPGRTRPTQVSEAWRRLFGGMQAQSS